MSEEPPPSRPPEPLSFGRETPRQRRTPARGPSTAARRGSSDETVGPRRRPSTTRELQVQLVGQTLGGRYKIHGILGEGGMGTVFDGEHLGLGRQVAIKVLSPSQAKKNVAVKRFQQEARAAGAIGHPNICEVYDFGLLDDGSPYLVMEKLVGQTLAERIAKDGGLPFDDVVEITVQVLAGLAAAHDKGIVHRDIKPENIFLARRGTTTTVKLLDFGVSKMMAEFQSPDDALDLTRTGMVMGTPYYMSPEQARGERNLDGRVDVYACGVVMYEAIAGKRPFLAPNYNALLLAIINTVPTSLRELRPSTPPELETIIARAMARNRADRFGSAREMLRALLPAPEPVRRSQAPASMPPQPQSRRPTTARMRAQEAPPRARSPEPPPAVVERMPSSVDIPIHFSVEDDAPLSEDDETEIYRPGRVVLPDATLASPPLPSTARTANAPPLPDDDWGATVVSKPPAAVARENARRAAQPQPFNPEQTVKLEAHELEQLARERTSPRRRR